jgi:hypothetical protein
MKIKAEAKAHLGYLNDKSSEELIDMIADLQLQLKLEKAQGDWLDRLADHLRDHANFSDHEGFDESKAEVDELYDKLKDLEKVCREKLTPKK